VLVPEFGIFVQLAVPGPLKGPELFAGIPPSLPAQERTRAAIVRRGHSSRCVIF